MMKISLRRKLILSYSLVIVLTLLTLSLTMNYFIQLELDSFYEGIRKHGTINLPLKPGDFPAREEFLDGLSSAMVFTAFVTGLIAISLGGLISYSITQPIGEVIAATKKIAKGKYSERVRICQRDEVGDLGRALNKMAKSLEENDKLKKELVDNVSHELATPLTNISGYLEALSDGVIKGKKAQEETLKLLQTEAKRLTEMVDDVRSLSCLESSSFKLKPKEQKLSPLIKKAIKQMKPQFDEKKLKVRASYVKDEPKLNVDGDRVIQILLNLLSNAVKFTPEKGTITINTSLTDEELILYVSDTGPGIPRDELPHIFERFYRTDKSRSRETGGTGIGLAIVQELMEAHHGSVEAENNRLKGACFTCRFPLN